MPIAKLKQFWKDNFEEFTETWRPENFSEQNPTTIVYWYRGRKRRKLITNQYSD